MLQNAENGVCAAISMQSISNRWQVKYCSRSMIRVALLCLVATAATHASQAAETGSLRAGAVKLDITPASMAGFYSVWAKRFDGVHDPIFVRALLVDNGQTSAAIIATDLVEFGDTLSLRQRIQRELGIPAEHIMISASHDHNAPRGGPIVPGTSSAEGRPYSPPSYVQLVDDRIVEALRKAKAALQPAKVGVGAGRLDINVNRNGYNGRGWGGADPEGASDKTVWVVKFETQSGQPLALLFNYGVHSVVAGSPNTLITGDLAGASERFIESQYQDKTVALFTMGPAGDQNPKFMSGPRDAAGNLVYDMIDAQGKLLGVEVIQTAGRITRMSSTANISAAQSSFSCETVPPAARPANAAPSPFAPNPDFKEKFEFPKTANIQLNLIKINQIALVGVSGEVFTKIYWRLRKDSPLASTIMVTMSNGRVGYLADDAAYDGPFRNPYVVRGCAETGIVDGLLGLINK